MTTIPSQPAIAATSLRKSYGETLALDGIVLGSPRERAATPSPPTHDAGSCWGYGLNRGCRWPWPSQGR